MASAKGSTTMWQPIQDSRLLDAVTQWLEPIRPSGALPAVGIQKAIFEVLPKVRHLLKHSTHCNGCSRFDVDAKYRWTSTLRH